MRFAALRFALVRFLNFIDPPELPDPAEHPPEKIVVPCLVCARRAMIAHGSQPPPLWSATYEPPEKQTGPIAKAHPTSKLLPLENVIGPNSTQSLPAIDPATGYYVRGDHRLMGKANHWHQRKGKDSA